MKVLLNPLDGMNLLSQTEVAKLQKSSNSPLYSLFRNCALAVLNVGTESDEVTNDYPDFEINLLSRERGIKIELINPPEAAFVDGKIITGIQEHLQ